MEQERSCREYRWKAESLPEPNFYVDRILRTPLSSVPPCQFGSLAVLEHGRTIPFSDIGLSTGAFVFVLGSSSNQVPAALPVSGSTTAPYCPQTP